MTAITHVYNYTVRCPHYKDPEHPVSWLNHIELNQSSEIALNRITKWHELSGSKSFETSKFVVRKADNEEAYFSMQSDRLKNDGHALVTFKIFLDTCCDDAAPEEIMQHLIDDYQQRLAKLDQAS
ncbi:MULTISPECIES: cytoplasmic protein [Shewanella]|uniref:Cytoplasmic protein n=2 Tax=Shewanella TaxID=22 RepID=A0A220UK54_9GAMM|nr:MULTISPECIES: cytoplasmic protein [Shewanella]QXN26147.1 cytoplasmic protein [Shewanella putrefaciens]ASK68495.1 cytoplasmic protein [Shewanella bicestrii]MCL1120575.1 cytoplasmic protein [Shewanella seohaensis]MDH0449526.1 cytoplasmic protein [Shewanella sp. GD04112]MDH1471223.1 cytoplasmic protein [Shewanella sp. GD03713]